MKIHLLRSPELSKETYSNVLNLLKPSIGPIEFFACDDILIESNSEVESRIWENKEDFEKLKNLPQDSYSTLMPEDSISFPYNEKVKTWAELFSECNNYRKLKKLPDEDLVVLLTDIGNHPNWFGGVSESMNNYFVQTSNWGNIFGNSVDIRYPIAYEVIIWVMRNKIFKNREAMLEAVHETPIGCFMDLCKDKTQIILKMRTAYVCIDCIRKIKDSDIHVLYPRQFFEIIDKIRNSLIFTLRSEILNKPSKLEINKHLNIFFTDLGNLELKLNPKEKIVYLLFLNNPNGIYFSFMKDYELELIELCKKVKVFGFEDESETEKEKMCVKAINILINPEKKDLNIVISRINKKIKAAVGDSLSNYYCIDGEKGKKKKIIIDREMVIRNDEKTRK